MRAGAAAAAAEGPHSRCRRRQGKNIEVVEASHPVPDEAGSKAARRILDKVSGLTAADDLVLALISGGGSALLALPPDGITLADKQAINRALLKCGADIAETNAVRKHLSAIKGGRLAVAAAPAQVVTLAISDVPGDDISVTASGPTAPDASTRTDALAVLAKYGIAIPASVATHLNNTASETPKPGDPRLPKVTNILVAAPQKSLEAVAKVARDGGLASMILGNALRAKPATSASFMPASRAVRRLGTAARNPCVLISGGVERPP